MFEQHQETNNAKKLLTIAGISLFLGILFTYFFFGKLPGISLPIYVLFILIGLALLGKMFSVRIPRVTWLLGLLTLFFASMVFVRDSGALIPLNILACLVLLVLITVSVLGKRLQYYFLTDYLEAALAPFKILRTALATVAEIITLKPAAKTSHTPQILTGLGLAVPVLVLFVILFSSADLVFAKYLGRVLSININTETVARIGLALAVAFVFIGAYTFTLRARREGTANSEKQPARSLGLLTSSILLGSVNALFLVFVIIQIAYLFGGQANIAAQGFTYAEYARQGFFELLAVAVVSLLLLLATEKYIVKKEMNHTGAFKLLSGALVLQVFLIIVSTFKRLALYEQAYGFTVLRLYSHVFTIWLGLIFLLLLYKIFINNSEQKFLFYGFISIVAVWAIINLGNPDAFIARQNLRRFETTGKLDTAYLSFLSEDAVGEMVKGLNINNPDVKGAIGHALYWDLSTKRESRWYNSWLSTNLSRRHGMKIFEARRSELEQYKDFQGGDPSLGQLE